MDTRFWTRVLCGCVAVAGGMLCFHGLLILGLQVYLWFEVPRNMCVCPWLA